MTTSRITKRTASPVAPVAVSSARAPSKTDAKKPTMASAKGFKLVVDGDAFLPTKADVVDSRGTVIGSRQVRDRSLIGKVHGFKRIIEGAEGEPTERTYLDKVPRLLPDKKPTWPGSEVRTLVEQGPSKNRIDLTIVGDGYTSAEKDKFFADAKKITDELFGNDTFKSYLPLFNVHAVFVPSKQSGIGNGRPGDTALGLYRDARMKQAVMPGNESAARKATQLAPDTDYPILVANDKLYGGLGGEFAITTSAPLNITTVLRHELGHNFGRVGEEYDGGQVYDGANFSRSSSRLPWAHFVKGETHVHEADLLHYSAPWKELSRGEWQATITVPADSALMRLDFSSLGFDTKDDVELLIDGKPVAYDGLFNYDRNFYRVEMPLAPGKHTVTFREKAHDGNNVLSKVNVYALPKDFPTDKSIVGAFGNYREGGSPAGFRPTQEDCLMRDMMLRHFCSPCQENMWRNFLKEVSLIDGITHADGKVRAQLVPLGAERLQVSWIDPAGKARPELDGKLEWATQAADKGKWKLRVAFVSDEVKDPGHEAWSVHNADFELR